MASSREILKKLFQKEFRWNIIYYLFGSGGLIGAFFLFYYYKNQQPRLRYQQKTTLPSDPEKADSEKPSAHTTVAEAIGNEIKSGNLNNQAIGPHPKSVAIDNKVEEGDLSNRAIQSAGSMDKMRLDNSLPSTDPREQAAPTFTPNPMEKSPKKYFSSPIFQPSTVDEKKVPALVAHSSHNTVIGGSLYNLAIIHNFGSIHAPLVALPSGMPDQRMTEVAYTDKDVTFSDLLRCVYRSRGQLPINRLTGISLSLEKGHYGQLTIVSQEEQKEAEGEIFYSEEKKSEEIARDDLIGYYEEKIYATKTPIMLEALFEYKIDEHHNSAKTPQKLLVLGRAGIGKSTFCQYVAWCWAEKKLWNDQFDAVFNISLRDLENYSGENDRAAILSWFIHEIWIEDQKKKWDETNIKNYLEYHEEKILFLLDGFDEVAHLKEQNTPAGKALDTLIAQKHIHIVVTSRPNYVDILLEGTQHGTQKWVDRCVENIGFSHEHIQLYVENFFKEHQRPEGANTVLTYLYGNPNIYGIAHVPINLSLICGLWYNDIIKSRGFKNMISVRTMTGLYQAMVNALFNDYFKKTIPRGAYSQMSNSTKEEEKKGMITFLNRLAFVALQGERREILIKAKVVNDVFDEVSETIKHLIEKNFLKIFKIFLILAF